MKPQPYKVREYALDPGEAIPWHRHSAVTDYYFGLEGRVVVAMRAPAAEIARAEKSYFPRIGEAVLADCIATYQKLGCWTRHVEITRAAYEKTLDVFEFNGQLKARYPYEKVCAEPSA